MNYGRLGELIAIALMFACAVRVLVCLVALWLIGPVLVAVGMTVLIIAIAVMLFCFEMDRR